MRLLHSAKDTSAQFDDPNLVSCAGLVPVMRLAQDCDLAGLVAEHLKMTAAVGANAHLKIPGIVAGMLAGADSIDDLDVLRHGGMGELFGGVRAPSTLGSFLRGFDGATCATETVSRATRRRPHRPRCWPPAVMALGHRLHAAPRDGTPTGRRFGREVVGYPLRLLGLNPCSPSGVHPHLRAGAGRTRLRGGAPVASARQHATATATDSGDSRTSVRQFPRSEYFYVPSRLSGRPGSRCRRFNPGVPT